MKRARSPTPQASRKRVRCDQCWILDLPAEVRGEIRSWLDVRARRRLHLTCRATRAEELPRVFDFPLAWLEAIRMRDGLPKGQGWMTDGDMARAVWSLGWHSWPGLVECSSLARDNLQGPRVAFRNTNVELEYAPGEGFFFLSLEWARGWGIEAHGVVPVPITDIEINTNWTLDGKLGVLQTLGHDWAVATTVKYFQSLAMKYTLRV